jgi:hypothetical protein
MTVEDVPSKAPTYWTAALFPFAGLFVARRHTKRARALGVRDNRYWKTYGWGIATHIAGQIAFWAIIIAMLGAAVSSPTNSQGAFVAPGQPTQVGPGATSKESQFLVDLQRDGIYNLIMDYETGDQRSAADIVGLGHEACSDIILAHGNINDAAGVMEGPLSLNFGYQSQNAVVFVKDAHSTIC